MAIEIIKMVETVGDIIIVLNVFIWKVKSCLRRRRLLFDFKDKINSESAAAVVEAAELPSFKTWSVMLYFAWLVCKKKLELFQSFHIFRRINCCRCRRVRSTKLWFTPGRIINRWLTKLIKMNVLMLFVTQPQITHSSKILINWTIFKS